MSVERKIPVSECFLSPQGEGFNVGRLMVFVRLAGCTVGKPLSVDAMDKFVIINNYQHVCTVADGRQFACDTDYDVKFRFTAQELLTAVNKIAGGCKNICLTGGEPLMHSAILKPFLNLAITKGYKFFLETSGTIELTNSVLDVFEYMYHVAVSPKDGFIADYCDYADEIKLLVDADFNVDTFPHMEDIKEISREIIFLQPINGEDTINMENLKLCLELQKQNPTWLISSQAHKLWGVQ